MFSSRFKIPNKTKPNLYFSFIFFVSIFVFQQFKSSIQSPPDVLRELYESSALAGDIENEGNDIALHNFLAGSTENDTTTA